ncbi:unnamed protein product [Phytomonas sp. EM1]|nr:unnamed protein product [Phytomonas sp. EM1]|eukprot:CCW60183.1 unnamed protein product [Phytomonas sp. isolate EM1]
MDNPFNKVSTIKDVSQHSATSPVMPLGFSTQSTSVTEIKKPNEPLVPSNDNTAPTSRTTTNTQFNETSKSVGGFEALAKKPQLEENVWRCKVCGKIKDLKGTHLNNKLEVRSDCWPCGKKQTFVRSGPNVRGSTNDGATVSKLVANDSFVAKKDSDIRANELSIKEKATETLPNVSTVLEGGTKTDTKDTSEYVWRCKVCNKVKDLHGPHLVGRTEVRSDCWPCGKKQTFLNSSSENLKSSSNKSVLSKSQAPTTSIPSVFNPPEHFRPPSIPSEGAEASFIIAELPISTPCNELKTHGTGTSEAATQLPVKNTVSSFKPESIIGISADCSAKATPSQSVDNVGGDVWRCKVCNKVKDLHGPHLVGRTEVRSDCWPCGKKQTFICPAGVSAQTESLTHITLTKTSVEASTSSTHHNGTSVEYEALAQQKSTPQKNSVYAQPLQPEAGSKPSFNDNHFLKVVDSQRKEHDMDHVNFSHVANNAVEKMREEATAAVKSMKVDFDTAILDLRSSVSDLVSEKGDKVASMITNTLDVRMQELNCTIKENAQVIERMTSKAIEVVKGEVLTGLDKRIEKGFEEIRKEISRLVTDISLDFLRTVTQRASLESNDSYHAITQSTSVQQSFASRHLSNAFE